MNADSYINELEDAALRLRSELLRTVDKYNDFADSFYFNTLSELTAVSDDLSHLIFDAASGGAYINDTFDNPEGLADQLSGRDYSLASAAWTRLEIAASMVDTVRNLVSDIQHQLYSIEIPYIGDDISDVESL